MNVLLVEDDALLAEGLIAALNQSGHEVSHAEQGQFALGLLNAYAFDLVILDLGLPDMDGIDVLRKMRRDKHRVPVLVLTARDGVEQQVTALDAGADDYMEKPFDLRKLEARIRALIRRSHSQSQDEISIGNLTVNPLQRGVTLANQRLNLPAREYEVLEALAINSPSVVHKARLAQRLMVQSEDIGDNAVEVYIHRLRGRLKGSEVAIRTVRGVGYLIESEP